MSDGTITALATPKGRSAIAIIRVSGGRCRSLFELLLGRANFSPRVLHRAEYISVAGDAIDDVLAVFFATPNSYTGEDAIEVYCHGNVLIVERIVEDLCLRCCRLAEPGEFTRRAFSNGKLDLCQAEAVADIIHGSSARAIAVARKQLAGSLTERINSLSGELVGVLAGIEREIDFSDGDSVPPEIFRSLGTRIGKISENLDALMGSNRYRSAIDGGIATVILGAPNAGKSSLFNCLLGRDRAIVSDAAGTTRDLISERIFIGDAVLQIWDTAGLADHAACEVEKIGMGKAVAMAREAELFLIVIAVNAGKPPELPGEISHLLSSKNSLLILNKVDLPKTFDCHTIFPGIDRVEISLKNSTTPRILEEKIRTLISTGAIWPDAEDVVVNACHCDIFRRASESLSSAKLALNRSQSLEVSALDIRHALEILGEIVGSPDMEVVLDAVFANFCVGK
jgi:tRNA modification GTPase